jgi:hypothetical protein
MEQAASPSPIRASMPSSAQRGSAKGSRAVGAGVIDVRLPGLSPWPSLDLPDRLQRGQRLVGELLVSVGEVVDVEPRLAIEEFACRHRRGLAVA